MHNFPRIDTQVNIYLDIKFLRPVVSIEDIQSFNFFMDAALSYP